MSYGKWHRTPSSRTVCAILDRSSRMSRVIGALYRLLYDGVLCRLPEPTAVVEKTDRKSTRLNSSHVRISYAVFCLKKKTKLSGGPCSRSAAGLSTYNPQV